MCFPRGPTCSPLILTLMLMLLVAAQARGFVAGAAFSVCPSTTSIRSKRGTIWGKPQRRFVLRLRLKPHFCSLFDTLSKRHEVRLALSLKQEEDSPASPVSSSSSSVTNLLIFGTVGFSYWYFLVLIAAIASSHPAWVPDWIPLTPGWPPSDADLAPAMDDSLHFFYLSDILERSDVLAQDGETALVTLRHAVFNVAEAWIFGFLPLLLATNQSSKRLPIPVVVVTWLGGLGLTNAFLAPYLAARECKGLLVEASSSKEALQESSSLTTTATTAVKIFRVSVAVVTALVMGIALTQVLLALTADDSAALTLWNEWNHLISSDRTYMAFVVDLILFSFFQALLLDELQEPSSRSNIHKIPILGLLVWLLQ